MESQCWRSEGQIIPSPFFCTRWFLCFSSDGDSLSRKAYLHRTSVIPMTKALVLLQSQMCSLLQEECAASKLSSRIVSRVDKTGERNKCNTGLAPISLIMMFVDTRSRCGLRGFILFSVKLHFHIFSSRDMTAFYVPPKHSIDIQFIYLNRQRQSPVGKRRQSTEEDN